MMLLLLLLVMSVMDCLHGTESMQVENSVDRRTLHVVPVRLTLRSLAPLLPEPQGLSRRPQAVFPAAHSSSSLLLQIWSLPVGAPFELKYPSGCRPPSSPASMLLSSCTMMGWRSL